METVITVEIIVMLCLLALTVFLFVSEIFRVDVSAMTVMVLLGLLTLVPGLETIISSDQLLSGFSSNAVIALIAVMIIGKGLDRTGMLHNLAGIIAYYAKRRESAILIYVTSAAGMVSGFMQNVGAAALFMPVVSRVCTYTRLHISQLLMPMGFCIIVGGTITMVGSSPLILLNDLLPDSIREFGLFEVTPIGMVLLAACIAYFMVLGKHLLPKLPAQKNIPESNTAAYFKRIYNIDAEIYEIKIPVGSSLHGLTVEQIEAQNPLRVIAAKVRDEYVLAPARDIFIEENTIIAVLAGQETVNLFISVYGLILKPNLDVYAEQLAHTKAGISEVVIPPNSSLIGKTVGEIWMRKTYGLSVINIHRGENNIYEMVRDTPLRAGDTLVCHSDWQYLARILGNRDFIVITTEFPHEETRQHKVQHAITCLIIVFLLIVFTDLRISIALLAGALGMVLSGVLKMDEAYQAISWKTIFLLVGLIPLGIAAQNSGTAAWIAHLILDQLSGASPWVLQTALALLTTFFTLFMSNVGATVLLVPLAINIALSTGSDPRMFALIVALAASNGFLLPTQQVNALIMTPGGYSTRDFMRVGGPMSIVFLIVMIMMVNFIF